jgi:tetratricopeptide (TPR) repeat protein
MTASIERARLLLAQDRYDLAEKELRRVLAEDPELAIGHVLLSDALGALHRAEEALAEADRAVGLMPDWGLCHYIRARALDRLDRLDDAKAAARQAIQLDPEDADFHATHAGILYQQRRWGEALEAAESGLSHDPENVDCINFRGLALTKLGRRGEAQETLTDALSLDPENALSHGVRGWTCLESDEPQAALEHFRTALAIDPNLEMAQQGMVEALKARYLVYRLLLQYFLWMQRLSGRAQWAILIGLFVAQRLVSQWMKASPQLAPVLVPLLVAYLVFCVLTWIATPLFNLLLRLNKYGRHALSQNEVTASNWFGGFVAAGLVLLAVSLITGQFVVLLLAGWCLLMLQPVALAMCHPKPTTRRGLCLAAALLGAVGLVAVGLIAANRESGGVGAVFFLGWFAFPWILNAVTR